MATIMRPSKATILVALTSSRDSFACRSHQSVSRSCKVISVSPDLSDQRSCKALKAARQKHISRVVVIHIDSS